MQEPRFAILTGVMLAVTLALPCAPAQSAGCGDCDGDGIAVTVVDALTAALIGSGALMPSAQQQITCDVDTSQAVTATAPMTRPPATRERSAMRVLFMVVIAAAQCFVNSISSRPRRPSRAPWLGPNRKNTAAMLVRSSSRPSARKSSSRMRMVSNSFAQPNVPAAPHCRRG